MFADSRDVASGTRIEADICLIGGGAAGITLARELSGQPLRVCLLESGDFDLESETQSLYEGELAGVHYYALDASRLRFFGGTTNHWGGASRPLEPLDFQRRPWAPNSGWPFDKEHLDPFYRRAHDVCQIGPYDYGVEAWERLSAPRLDIASDRVFTAMLRRRPLRFGEAYRDLVAGSETLTCFLHSNAVHLQLDQGGRSVRHVEVASLEGVRFSVRAKAYVVATGTIENARLLLASNDVQSRGIGNDHDLVGRFFMEHPRVDGAAVLLSNPETSLGLYEGAEMAGVRGEGFLTFSEEFLTREEMLNVRAYVEPYAPGVGDVAPGVETALRGGSGDKDLVHGLALALADLDDVTVFAYRKLFGLGQGVRGFRLRNHVEQVPNPESRVELVGERDPLGMPRVRLTWRFGELERRTVRKANEALAADLGRAGVGRVKILPDDPETGWPPGLRGDWHQMGTTRMHDDPRRGVVDPDCRVHGVSNLYVAGSSVFPTSGYTNPTLTIVALAVRLADYLTAVVA